MKILLTTLISITVAFNCLSQSFSSLVVYVSDSENGKPVSAALISIKEAGWASKTTGSDGKTFFENSMPLGEIHYIVIKEGYEGKEGSFNITTELKSNTINIKLSKFRDDKILITGKVVNENERDMEGIIVEVRVADIFKKTQTDASGYYRIELNLSTDYDKNTIIIEAKCSDGSNKKTETINLTRGNVIHKDLKISCGDIIESSPKFEKDNLLIALKGCRQSGNNILCKVQITSIGQDSEFGTWFRYNGISTRIMDELGNEYFVESVKLANISNNNQGWTEKTLVSDFPIEGTFIFGGVNRKVSLLTKFEIYGWHETYRNYFLIPFGRIQLN